MQAGRARRQAGAQQRGRRGARRTARRTARARTRRSACWRPANSPIVVNITAPRITSATTFSSVWETSVPSTAGRRSRGRPSRRATISARDGSPSRAGSVADIRTPIVVPCIASAKRGPGVRHGGLEDRVPGDRAPDHRQAHDARGRRAPRRAGSRRARGRSAACRCGRARAACRRRRRRAAAPNATRRAIRSARWRAGRAAARARAGAGPGCAAARPRAARRSARRRARARLAGAGTARASS